MPGDQAAGSVDIGEANRGAATAATAASADACSPNQASESVDTDEANLDNIINNIIKASLQLAVDILCVVINPITLWTGMQDSKRNGCFGQLCKSPTKRLLSPESVHRERSAIPKRRHLRLPATY